MSVLPLLTLLLRDLHNLFFIVAFLQHLDVLIGLIIIIRRSDFVIGLLWRWGSFTALNVVVLVCFFIRFIFIIVIIVALLIVAIYSEFFM